MEIQEIRDKKQNKCYTSSEIIVMNLQGVCCMSFMPLPLFPPLSLLVLSHVMYSLWSVLAYCSYFWRHEWCKRQQSYSNPFLSPTSWSGLIHHAVIFGFCWLSCSVYFCPLCPPPSLPPFFSFFLCRTPITVIKKLVAGMNSLLLLLFTPVCRSVPDHLSVRLINLHIRTVLILICVFVI